MILPIVAYGSPVLRKKCEPITDSFPNLKELITNMWETMDNAGGVGLSAPQINRGIRIFMIDSKKEFQQLSAKEKKAFPDDPGIRTLFINAQIIDYSDETWIDGEGCLSMPGIVENIARSVSITMLYQDENFKEHTKTFQGLSARMIQHEYDHIEGRLLIDYMSPLKRKLLNRKLTQIRRGKIKSRYPMLFS